VSGGGPRFSGVPTFERLPRCDREFRQLLRELQRAFLAMLPAFMAALRETPPSFPPAFSRPTSNSRHHDSPSRWAADWSTGSRPPPRPPDNTRRPLCQTSEHEPAIADAIEMAEASRGPRHAAARACRSKRPLAVRRGDRRPSIAITRCAEAWRWRPSKAVA
jgi:hypothetical protein